MLGSWKTMPMDLRTCVASLTISNPFTLAVPEVGLRMVQSIEMVVVFPAPLGPNKPKTSPDSTPMSSSSTAVSELNDFVSLLVSMALTKGCTLLSEVLDIMGRDLYLFVNRTPIRQSIYGLQENRINTSLRLKTCLFTPASEQATSIGR